MEIQFQLTQRDFYEALSAHRNKVSFRRWPFLFLMLVQIVMLASLTFDVVVRGRDLASYTPLFIVIAMLVFCIWLSPRWGARNQFRKQPSAQGAKSVTITESGVHSSWDGGATDVEWKNFIRMIEARNLFLIYTSPVCFGMLPKRAFTDEQMIQFRSLAKANILAK